MDEWYSMSSLRLSSRKSDSGLALSERLLEMNSQQSIIGSRPVVAKQPPAEPEAWQRLAVVVRKVVSRLPAPEAAQ